ncbi:MAG: hypothetical protein RLZZ499_2311 [Cyanobacteriota bacterium]
MDTANQQRILGYFIEEAKEHLQTLEQGILQLATSVQDTETVNEMFRAAHSVRVVLRCWATPVFKKLLIV